MGHARGHGLRQAALQIRPHVVEWEITGGDAWGRKFDALLAWAAGCPGGYASAGRSVRLPNARDFVRLHFQDAAIADDCAARFGGTRVTND
jgi:hypothetical protein